MTKVLIFKKKLSHSSKPSYQAKENMIKDKWAERNLAMPKARIRSLPKTLAIFLSGTKNCLFSGSWRLFFLMYAQSCLMHSARLASFLPTMSPNSALSFMGLVSPAPLGMLKFFVLFFGFQKNLKKNVNSKGLQSR